MRTFAPCRTGARPRASRNHRLGSLLTGLLLAACWTVAAAAQESRAIPVTITRGETYAITAVAPGIEPQVRTIENPNALIVERQPDGSVVVLGAERGVGEVSVRTPEGAIAKYVFTVQAASNPANPLEPGEAAPTESGTAPSTAGPLDAGAGPVNGSRAEVIVEPANSASNSGGPAATPAPAPSATNGGAQAMAEGSPAVPPTVTRAQRGAPRFANNPPAPLVLPPETTDTSRSMPDDTIAIRFGTSRVFSFEWPIKRVSIADSDIADVQVVDPHQMMLIGRKPGFTTLALWDNQGHYQERQVRIEASGHQQVMLNVLVAQIERQTIENQGVDLAAALTNYGVSIVGLPGQVATPYAADSVLVPGSSTGGILPPGGSIIPLLLSNNITYGLTGQNSNVQTQALFQFLEQHSLARVLARPRLVANSGQEAKFLSGGEIPIVIAQALNSTIVFKPFGTSLVIVPTVVGKDEIELAVKPEVSRPDFTQAVTLFGFTVPSFIEQKAETVVRMKDRQTLFIAGLIQRERRSQVHKVPYLGDVPYLGGLFRNTEYQDLKTELVMSVTPEIVLAVPAGVQTLYPAAETLHASEIRTERTTPPDASRPRF